MHHEKVVHTIPSTAKLLMTNWMALREIMAKITQTRKEKQEGNTPDLTHLITDKQIFNAFYGPYHPLIQKLTKSYALINRIRTYFVITQDDNIKPHIQKENIELPKNINTDINAASLDKIQKQLDVVAKTHFQQWEENVNNWGHQFVMQLTLNEINLSEHEIENFSAAETLSELLDQFTDLSLELPLKKNERYSFTDYFQLKSILCIQSALSRQHKPHDKNEIDTILKNFKRDFKQITQEENNLITQFNQEVDALLKF
jgi:hypothetical protein